MTFILPGHRGFPLSDLVDDVRLGRTVIEEGGLKVIRQRLGWSRNAMAEFLYTSVQTYTQWEIDPNTRVWPNNAGRIGRFYRSAMKQLNDLEADGIDIKTLMPFHEYASYAGLPQEILMRQYREGQLEALDLGILGLWVDRA